MKRDVLRCCIAISMLSVVIISVDGANLFKSSGEDGSSTSVAERDGDATTTSTCTMIRDVPAELRQSDAIKPNGLSDFYTKYTEAYGIPVLSSSSVSDRGLVRACYVLRFLLADRQDLRQAYYKSFGRVAVIAQNETIKDIPEYSVLDNITRESPRSLGAVSTAPVSTGPEENLLCAASEQPDDFLIKSLAIGIFNLAVVKGEGVQSFNDVNGYAKPPDGHHNEINKREKLRTYDSWLFLFVVDIFPCANSFIKRCHNRENEHYQNLSMNCPPSGWNA